MVTYEYQCTVCGLRFERRQAITEAPVTECPDCHGEVQRLLSGGAAVILKGAAHARPGHGSACALEHAGRTCCGREERCGKPPCGSEE
jgi:putative FmdB family regulatory protein